ncbi:MAG: L-2-amino-thiazoline-4-carboxylic acid hydrolase [Anaerolineales bacterium]
MRRNNLRWFKFLVSGYLRRNAMRLWTNPSAPLQLTPAKVKKLLKSTWERYFENVEQIPQQFSVGNWLMMQLAFLSLAAHRTLEQFGFDDRTSNQMIYQLSWHITSSWTKRAQRFSRFLFTNQKTQLRYFVGLIMKVLFNPPGYQFQTGDMENGFFLDVRRCPVAELMKTHGKSELCVDTWCSVDFGLVKIFDGILHRTGTIAMGKEKCDFQFLEG